MSDLGYVNGLLAGLPQEQQAIWKQIFQHVLKQLRVGLPGHLKPAVNLAWVQVDGTTHATANTEFSIVHGLQEAPRVAFPCLDLTTANAQVVPLVTSRAADARRIYLTSSSTNAACTLFVEAR